MSELRLGTGSAPGGDPRATTQPLAAKAHRIQSTLRRKGIFVAREECGFLLLSARSN
jgi:hypothetical protein